VWGSAVAVPHAWCNNGGRPQRCQAAGVGCAGACCFRPSPAVVARAAGHACKPSGVTTWRLRRPSAWWCRLWRGGRGGILRVRRSGPLVVHQKPATVHKSKHGIKVAQSFECRTASIVEHCTRTETIEQPAVPGAFRGDNGGKTVGAAEPRGQTPSDVANALLFDGS
jgi:hypothetical protein